MLTGSAAKWYIELPRASFHDFNSLSMSFLTHFQLPIRYETGTELLTSLRQKTSIHISDHIHEWRRRRRLIKVVIPDQLLAEWFTKSLLPQIARDVAMGGIITELHPFRHLGEQIRGAYMPSWVLLSMTAVEERVRERKTKL
jgi:hypothetical protein